MILLTVLLAASLPLIAGGLLCAAGDRLREKTVCIITAAVYAATAALCVAVFRSPDFALSDGLFPSVRLDTQSRIFALLTVFTSAASGIFPSKNVRRVSSLGLLLCGLLLWLSFAGDMLTLFVFFALTAAVSALLSDGFFSNRKVLVCFAAGICCALVGAVGLYITGGRAGFIVGGVERDNAVLLTTFSLFAVFGFGGASGLLPFGGAHGFLGAPAPCGAVLSGAVGKAGIFCLIRVICCSVGPLAFKRSPAAAVTLAAALLSMLVMTAAACRSDGLLKRLSYSAAAQGCLIITGTALLSDASVTGVVICLVFHSVISSGLFFCAYDLAEFNGGDSVSALMKAPSLPAVTSRSTAALLFALAGIPPFAGFIGIWYITLGAFKTGGLSGRFAAAALLFNLILTYVYSIPPALRFMTCPVDRGARYDMRAPIYAVISLAAGVFAYVLIGYVRAML